MGSLRLTSLIGICRLLAVIVLGVPVPQNGQIPAAPLPEPSGVLIEPALLGEAVEWADRSGGSVGYTWVGEVRNYNTVPIQASVTLLLHDSGDQVIHRDAIGLVVGPGRTRGFNMEGRVDEEIAIQADHWTFGVEGSLPTRPEMSPSDYEVPVAASANRELTLQIVRVDARAAEIQDTWWRISWRLILRNNWQVPITVDATIEFLDFDGLVVDDTVEHDLEVGAGEEKTFTGYGLVSAHAGPRIQSAKARLRSDSGVLSGVAEPTYGVGSSDPFLSRIPVYRRHFTEEVAATLTLYKDHIEYDEPGGAQHSFELSNERITKITRSSIGQWYFTLHFDSNTAAGNTITVTGRDDFTEIAQLVLFVNQYCPNAKIEIHQE